MQTIYKELYEIDLQINELESKKEAIRVKVKEDMQKDGVRSIKNEYYTISLSERNKYQYSKVVQKIEEDLAIKKINEVESGKAKVISVTNSIIFKPITK